ncbi:hypothetical protein ATY41_09965 [Leifsonia xyli subsp. xyli]|uniref:Uncharacterized protein n=1 Tax=Leifsonia xyli subsp. xyli TaxID=59736 RepID=A0A1E2SLN2_LEIXY|nr:hypothetical protein ATY41_09965 [Leifsonia xyli subsp. xyli]
MVRGRARRGRGAWAEAVGDVDAGRERPEDGRWGYDGGLLAVESLCDVDSVCDAEAGGADAATAAREGAGRPTMVRLQMAVRTSVRERRASAGPFCDRKVTKSILLKCLEAFRSFETTIYCND